MGSNPGYLLKSFLLYQNTIISWEYVNFRNFLSPPWKLDNPYCHTQRPYKPKFNFDSPEFTRAKRQKKVQNFNRNPVSFNTVEENPSNLPGYQQINENPTPAKFNFQDSQQFSRPNRQKNRNPVRFNTVSDNISNSPNYESPQKPTPAKFNFDYDSTVVCN